MRYVVTGMVLLFTITFMFDTSAKETKETNKKDQSIIFFGDSITDGMANDMISWDYYMNQLNPFKKSTNAGSSGATFSNSRKINMIVTQVLNHKNEHYDYVLIQGGVNDAMDEVPIGTMNDSYDPEDFDMSTFIGAVDMTLYYLTSYYNSSAFGMVITYPTPDALEHGWRGNASEPQAYYNALKEVCKKWEVPYIDFFSGELSTVIGDEELLDGLHLNSQGYEKIAPYLLEFIQGVSPYHTNLKRQEEIKNSGLKYYNLTY